MTAITDVKTKGAERRKILLVFYGGTFGMLVEWLKVRKGIKRKVNVVPDNFNKLERAIAGVLDLYEDFIDFEVEFLEQFDSNWIVPSVDYSAMAERVRRAQKEGMDAVGFVMGTDTLMFAGCGIALPLAGLNRTKRQDHIPVAITGSQRSIHNTFTDAPFNLSCMIAVLLRAIEMEVSEVLVVFWALVLRAVSGEKVSERKFEAFDSIGAQKVGWLDALGEHLVPRLLHLRNTRPLLPLQLANKWGGGVLPIDAIPGLEPDMLKMIIDSGLVRALIMRTQGEGNVCTRPKPNFSLLPVVKHAVKNGVPFFLCSSYAGGLASAQSYAAGSAAVDAGAIPCFGHSFPATCVKVQWLAGNFPSMSIDDWRERFCHSYAGEFNLSAASSELEKFLVDHLQ